MSRERGSGASKRAALRAALAFPLIRLGAKARHLLFVVPDPWPADPEAGRRMLAAPEPLAWDAAGASGLDPHRFGWLRDLRAVGGDAARRRCQRLLKDWISRHGEAPWRPLWTSGMLADRIVHWLGAFDFVGKTASQSWKGPFFRSLARQALALARAAPGLAITAERIRALRALVAFGAAVPGAQTRLRQAMRLLLPMLERWPESGLVVERNPSHQLSALRDLIDIRTILVAAQHDPPAILEAVIGRAGRALAAMRHGDGRLALFHGSVEERAEAIDAALAVAGIEAALPLRYSGGFERAMVGGAVLIVDAAAPPPNRHSRDAHAGTLAFEFAAGAQRLIVNCGAYRGRDPAWREAGRVTAAHSTLVVGDRNSAALRSEAGLRRRPAIVWSERQEGNGATWIAASHDGYLRRFGVLHRRRLFLAADGTDLRGEDRLAPPEGARIARRHRGVPFAIRFHLHPRLAVGEVKRGAGGASTVAIAAGEEGRWTLVAEGKLAVSIEESFYLGDGAAPIKTKQIVLSGSIERAEGVEARWAIRKMR